MQLKLFWQEGCKNCDKAKKLCSAMGGKQYDVNTVEGLAEASYHGVLSTPTFIVVDDDEREIGAWRGKIPTKREVKEALGK